MAEDRAAFTPLTDQKSFERAMSLDIKDVVHDLVDMLGLSLVAVIAGVGETRAVQQWMKDREPQRPQTLRFALQVALMITESTDGSMVRAWFQGSNPQLDDLTPALMLRNQPLADVQGPIIAAAREFAAR